MNREQENEAVINVITKAAKEKQTGTFEELVTFHMGTIATMLADISKSLAILADRTEIKFNEDKPFKPMAEIDLNSVIKQDIINRYKTESEKQLNEYAKDCGIKERGEENDGK